MKSKIPRLDPARSVVEMFGGPAKVAPLVNRDPLQIYRWMWPKGVHRGLGGRIPHDCAQILLFRAKDMGIKLKPDDFFLPTEPAE